MFTVIWRKVNGQYVKNQLLKSKITGEKYATKVEDDFILHIATAHRIPAEWIQRSVNALIECKEGCLQDKFYFISCNPRPTDQNYQEFEEKIVMWS